MMDCEGHCHEHGNVLCLFPCCAKCETPYWYDPTEHDNE